MPFFRDVYEARKMRDRLRDGDQDFMSRLAEWRKPRDRDTDDLLDAIKATLPDDIKRTFIPYQTPEPEDEIQTVKHVLASNDPELEVIAAKPGDRSKAQKLENGLEALNAELWPIDTRIDLYDAMLGDGIAYLVLDKAGPGPKVSALDDRAKLEKYAEKTPNMPAEDDVSAEANYMRAYVSNQQDHEKAYQQVFTEAAGEDGLLWSNRVPDTATCFSFIDKAGVAEWCEDAEVPVSVALKAIEDYGVKKLDNRLVLTRKGKPTDDDALGADRGAQGNGISAQGSLSLNGDTVRYTELRTRDATAILIDGLNADVDNEDASGILIEFDSPFPNRSCGVYLVSGHTKNRGTKSQRYAPAMLGMLVEANRQNIIATVRQALALSEATRPLYQTTGNQPGMPPPLDPSQETKGEQVRNGQTTPLVAGQIERVPTTEIDLVELGREINAGMERYRMRELFAGSGDSGESGRHLARLQTAQLTKLTPFQTKLADAMRDQLTDILGATVAGNESIYVPYLPQTDKAHRSDIQVAQSMEITPQMAGLSVFVRVTVGSETPESKYGRQQVSRDEVAIGTYGMTEHREIIGIKDPEATVQQMAVDSIVGAVLGTPQAPGMITQMIIQMVEQRTQQKLDAILPPPMPPPMPQGMPMGGPPPGPAGMPGPPPVGQTPGLPAPPENPVQGNEQGVPLGAGGPQGIA